MANLPYWDDFDGPWDKLWLADTLMPGVWEVEAECERDIDKKKSKGNDGARLKDHGYQPAAITFKGRILDDLESPISDWKRLQLVIPKIHPRTTGGKRSPLNVDHPALALLGIHTVYVRRIKAPRIVDNGILEIEIDCLEWVKPKPAKTAVNLHVPKKWSKEQLAANAGISDGNVPVSQALYMNHPAFTPGEIAAHDAKRVDDAQRAKELGDLLNRGRKNKIAYLK